MLIYLTDFGAALLALSGFALTLKDKVTARLAGCLMLASVAISVTQFSQLAKDLIALESALSLGLGPFVLLGWLCLLAKMAIGSFIQPHRLMILLAMTSWLIGHAALWTAEKTWLKPRFNAYQSISYQWLGDQPAVDQVAICKETSVDCESRGGSMQISSGFHALQYSVMVVDTLRILSAIISCCWGIGLFIVMIGHRRKVRA